MAGSADCLGSSFSADPIVGENAAYKHPHCSCRNEKVSAQHRFAGLLKKGDWPSYVEREPEAYEPEELDRLFAACDLRNRVLLEFF